MENNVLDAELSSCAIDSYMESVKMKSAKGGGGRKASTGGANPSTQRQALMTSSHSSPSRYRSLESYVNLLRTFFSSYDPVRVSGVEEFVTGVMTRVGGGVEKMDVVLRGLEVEYGVEESVWEEIAERCKRGLENERYDQQQQQEEKVSTYQEIPSTSIPPPPPPPPPVEPSSPPNSPISSQMSQSIFNPSSPLGYSLVPCLKPYSTTSPSASPLQPYDCPVNIVVHYGSNLPSDGDDALWFCRVSLLLRNNSVVIEDEVESPVVSLSSSTPYDGDDDEKKEEDIGPIFDTWCTVLESDNQSSVLGSGSKSVPDDRIAGFRISVWKMMSGGGGGGRGRGGGGGSGGETMVGHAIITTEDYTSHHCYKCQVPLTLRDDGTTLQGQHQQPRIASITVSMCSPYSTGRNSVVRNLLSDCSLTSLKREMKIAEEEKERIADLFYRMGEDPNKVAKVIIEYFDTIKKREKGIMEGVQRKEESAANGGGEKIGRRHSNLGTSKYVSNGFNDGPNGRPYPSTSSVGSLASSTGTAGDGSIPSSHSRHFASSMSLLPKAFADGPLNVKALSQLSTSCWGPAGEMILETRNETRGWKRHSGPVPKPVQEKGDEESVLSTPGRKARGDVYVPGSRKKGYMMGTVSGRSHLEGNDVKDHTDGEDWGVGLRGGKGGRESARKRERERGMLRKGEGHLNKSFNNYTLPETPGRRGKETDPLGRPLHEKEFTLHQTFS